MMRMPWLSSNCVVVFSKRVRIPSIRSAKWSTSISAVCCSRPIPANRLVALTAPPVAIIAFEGMQSSKCAAPPIMSRSIMVTSAPSRAAHVAAVFPPGPPPIITKRIVTFLGYLCVSTILGRHRDVVATFTNSHQLLVPKTYTGTTVESCEQ